MQGMLPIPTGKIKKSLGYLRIGNLAKIYNGFLNSIAAFCKDIRIIKPYDVVFAAGKIAIEKFGKESKVVAVNSFDYDEFLLAKHKNIRLVEGRYCVFIDENLPYNPDFKMFKLKSVEPVQYFNRLNRFFDIIEKKYGLKVVIAAHPKSNYGASTFENRLIYKYKTNDLVKNCEFVIVTASTAVSFAVFYEKPVIFVYDNQIKQIFGNTYVYQLILNMADSLGCPLYNIDSIFSPGEIAVNKVDRDKYDRYEYNFLVSKISENKLSKDIFCNYLMQSA